MWRSVVLVLVLSTKSSHLERQTPDRYLDAEFSETQFREPRPQFAGYPTHPPYTIPNYDTSDSRYPVLHASLPRGMTVTPLPLAHSEYDLVFNVSWLPPIGTPARDYSLDVTSETKTEDCRSAMCYEFNIPGNYLWHLIPNQSIVPQHCTLRPGCAYSVRLIAHPWDGHTALYKHVQLDECVAGVCSCAHAPRLPVPIVKAHTLAISGQIVVNVSWTLPPPSFPQRLPPDLQKHYYFVNIGKRIVSGVHQSPWYEYTSSRHINASGPVAKGDDVRWAILPIDERSGKRSGKKDSEQRNIVLDVNLLARVALIDNRSCVGIAGNATAYDPAEANKIRIGTYVLWTVFGGACVLAMVAILAVSARVVKRVLNALRPTPVSAPPEPLCTRPAWFPPQLRTNT